MPVINIEDVELFKTSALQKITKGYVNHGFFTVDEFGLFFKLMLGKTFAVKKEKCGGKFSNDSFMVLIGRNADGTKKNNNNIKPLITMADSREGRKGDHNFLGQ